MKKLFTLLLVFTFVSCTQQNDKIIKLQNKIDSLEIKLANTYKPGFGELMSGIQNHHSKLWFAGINKNWQLADFEVREIMELFDKIKKYQPNREESKSIDIINPSLETVNNAIKNKNLNSFKSSYKQLTGTCNDCHKITKFEFNTVKVPTRQVFTNQKF